MKDDEPTPEELREAEALARALDGKPGEAPPDALATAGLLRYARDEGALDEEGLLRRLRKERAGRKRGLWLWLLAPVAAAAATAVTLVQLDRAKTFAPPAPSGALLVTQAAAARGDDQALEALDRQMRAYRQAMFQQIGAR